MDHDQRFKCLLTEFFGEFLALFLPDWAPRFDLSRVEWLDKELFSDPPQGERRLVDLIARLPVREPPAPGLPAGGPWLVLVHVEAEDRVATLRQRIFQYYYLPRGRYDLPVLSIGLYLRVGLDGLGWDRYEESLWGRQLVSFQYPYIGLPALDGTAYLSGENLLGVALAALMQLPEERRLELGRAAWRRVVPSPENDYRRYLLCECVDAYLPRDEAQRQAFEQQVVTTAEPEERAMTVTLFDRIRQEGWEKGRQEGRMEQLRQNLLMLLDARFGPVSEPVRQRIRVLEGERLEELYRLALTATSLADLGLSE